jgi:hypothetical protein
MTIEEVLDLDAQHIATHGYLLQAVGDSADDPNGWVYSVGLVDVADHPELVITGAPSRTGALLSTLAEAVLDGDVFSVGDTIVTPEGIARVGPVHNVQYDLDTFAHWHRLDEYGAIVALDLSAVQIVMPGHHGPTLSDPHARVGEPMPNRATRRRRKRHRNAR